MGYDSDQSVALSEVGKVGVAVDTLEDIIEVFNGIPLDKVSVSFTINATAPIILAMFIAAARRQGVPPEKLRGTIQNDILKEYAARGTYIFPPEPSMRITTDVIEFCAKKLTQLNPISVSGYHIREAGATAVQEISFTLCSGIEYIKRVIERGLSVDDFASRVTFFFASHNNFFEEIAKFRAARRIWAGIIKNRFGALKPEAMKLKFHVQTSGVTLTSQEPENNILRVGYQALAAALGGAQSIHTNSFDEALALPAESSVLLALRTQQLIAYETGIADTVDPLGGAWFVEYMTDEVERRAEEYIKKVDQMGGMTKAVESGYIQREIACSAWEYQKAVEEGKMKVVGVNLFKSKREQKSQIFKISEDTLKRKLKKLEKVKKERDWDSVESSLRRLKEAAHGGENLMEPIVECVESYATLGEICSTLQMVFGRFKAPSEL
jgi:methylmalonyl-CoA mutase N-terminal domain/subunit